MGRIVEHSADIKCLTVVLFSYFEVRHIIIRTVCGGNRLGNVRLLGIIERCVLFYVHHVCVYVFVCGVWCVWCGVYVCGVWCVCVVCVCV